MATHNIVQIQFIESSKAYEALSDLRQSSASGNLNAVSAIIVERSEDGRLHLAEGENSRIGDATAGGSLIGMLVGILGGPLGILLGWGAGMIGGTIVDSKRADRSQTILGEMARRVAPGMTVIIAEVEEYAEEVLDKVAEPLGGTVHRVPATQVLQHVENAEGAARAAEQEANRVLREERRDERKETWQERLDAVKGFFSFGSGDDESTDRKKDPGKGSQPVDDVN